jgi:hypothetical protein
MHSPVCDISTDGSDFFEVLGGCLLFGDLQRLRDAPIDFRSFPTLTVHKTDNFFQSGLIEIIVARLVRAGRDQQQCREILLLWLPQEFRLWPWPKVPNRSGQKRPDENRRQRTLHPSRACDTRNCRNAA